MINCLIKFSNGQYWNLVSVLFAVIIGAVVSLGIALCFSKSERKFQREYNSRLNKLYSEIFQRMGVNMAVEINDKGLPFKAGFGAFEITGGGNIFLKGISGTVELDENQD